MTTSEIKRRIDGVKVPGGIAWIGKPDIDFVDWPITLVAFGPSNSYRIYIQVTADNECCLTKNTGMFTTELAALARYMRGIEKALEEK